MLLRLLIAVLLVLPLAGPTQGQDLGEILGTSDAASDAAEEPARQPIDTQSTPALDERIEQRLSGIYAQLDELAGITVDVSQGVVTLGGSAGSAAAVERALNLAGQVTDVVEVVDETTIDSSLNRRLESTLARWEANLRAAVAVLPTFLVAVLVFATFWWLARRLAARRAWFMRLTPNGFIADLVAGISRIVITLIGAVLALSLLDATSIIGTVVGAAGIVGLAVGFAVRDTVENYIASILLSLRQPFAVRDYVLINDIEGRVARLTSRATILISIDGNHVRIPNAEVYKAVIVNYTRNSTRRFEFTVGVDTELALQPAQRLAEETLRTVPGVLGDPPVLVLIDSLGDSNVSLTVYGWMDQRSHDLLKVRSESIRLVKRAFDDAGIVMPEPIYRLRVNTGAVSDLLPDSTQADSEGQAAPGGEDDDSTAGRGTAGQVDDDTRRATERTGPDDPLRPARTPVDSDGPVRVDGAAAGEPATAADTSCDTAINATLEEEIGRGDDENLLHADARQE